MYIDTSFSPNEHAQVEGTVVSIPEHGQLIPNQGLPAIKPGDQVAFSYQVVATRDQNYDQHEIFREVESENPLLTIWENGHGKKIFREYVLGGTIRASFLEKNQTAQPGQPPYNEIDRFEGTTEEFEHWFEQYYTDSSAYSEFHTNKVTINGKEYWRVRTEQIHAYIPAVGNTETSPGTKGVVTSDPLQIIPAPGQLLCRPRPKPEMLSFLNQTTSDWVEIIRGQPTDPNSMHDLTSGWVYVPLDRCPEYNFFGQDYVVVRIDQVMAHSLVKPQLSGRRSSKHLILQ